MPLCLLACARFEKKKGENPRGGHGSEKGVIFDFRVWGLKKKKSFFFQLTSHAFDSRVAVVCESMRESKAHEVS